MARLHRVTAPLDRLRANADELPPARPELAGYLDKVRERAYTVTDEDIAKLKAAGVSEDEIFEQTVGVAIREGFRRLDAAQKVIG
jgi:alkylhydroperoxidase family enzyme